MSIKKTKYWLFTFLWQSKRNFYWNSTVSWKRGM